MDNLNTGQQIGRVLAGRQYETTLIANLGLGQLRVPSYSDVVAILSGLAGAALNVVPSSPFSDTSIDYQQANQIAFIGKRNAVCNYTDTLSLMKDITEPAKEDADNESIFVTHKDLIHGLYQGYHKSDSISTELETAIALSNQDPVKNNILRNYMGMLLVVKRLDLKTEDFPESGVLNKIRGLGRYYFDSITDSQQTQSILAPILNTPSMLHNLIKLSNSIDVDVLEKIVKGEKLSDTDCLISEHSDFMTALGHILPDHSITQWLALADANELNQFWRAVSGGLPKVLGTNDTAIATAETALLIQNLPKSLKTGGASILIFKLMEQLCEVIPAGANRENVRAIHSGYARLFENPEENGYLVLFKQLDKHNTPAWLADTAAQLVPPPVSKWRSFKSALGFLFQAFIHNEAQARLRMMGSLFFILMFAFGLAALTMPFTIFFGLASVFLAGSVIMAGQYIFKAARMAQESVAVQSGFQNYMFHRVLGLDDPTKQQELHKLMQEHEKDENRAELVLQFLNKHSSTNSTRILLAYHALTKCLTQDSACSLLDNYNEQDGDELRQFYKNCTDDAKVLGEAILKTKVDLRVIGIPLLGKGMQIIPAGNMSFSAHLEQIMRPSATATDPTTTDKPKDLTP